MVSSKTSRQSPDRRGQRGSALAVVLFIVFLLAGVAVGWAVVAKGSASRSANERDLDEATAVGEAGLAFVVEQWRMFPDNATPQGSYPSAYPNGFLYVEQTETDGWAEITATNGPGVDADVLGTWFRVGNAGGGRFTVIGIQNSTVGSGGKVVRILAQFDNVNYTWEAVLASNTTSPIQGVGTQTTQSWSNGTFSTIGGGNGGSVFGNGNITIGTSGTINGNVASGGTVSSSGTITGTKTSNAAPITFPDQAGIVNNAEANAANPTVNPGSSFWGGTDPKTFLTNLLAPQSPLTRPTMEINILSSEPSTGLSSPNPTNWNNLLGKQAHLYVKGNGTQATASTQVLTLPGSTQYAFARLWIDAATVVITAPPGGGTLVMPDIYVTNGGRLILDTSLSTAPLTILNQGNNQYEFPGNYSVNKYTPATNSWGTATTSGSTMTGSTTAWNNNNGPASKPPAGNGSYDEWGITNNAFLATLTSSPTAQGAVFYNTAGTDFVMNNGGYIMGGIQTANSSTLLNGAMASAQGLFSSGVNASGWVGWSGGVGSNNARFNVNAHGGSPAASGYGGLTYGAYSGVIGSNGTLEGAFVGYSMNVSGSGQVKYDPSLASRLQAAAPNTNHVLTKRRIPDPAGAVLSQIP